MCVLGNVAIEKALADGNLVIEPNPEIGPGAEGSDYDEASVNLHLGDTIFLPEKDNQVTLNLSQDGNITKTLDANLVETPIPANGYNLNPGDFVLGSVREHVGFPRVSDHPLLMGRIEGRSKFARCGLLVHATAPTLQPLWDGHITFELTNVGYFPITIWPGAPLGQLIVETVFGDVVGAAGTFDGQKTATGGQGV